MQVGVNPLRERLILVHLPGEPRFGFLDALHTLYTPGRVGVVGIVAYLHPAYARGNCVGGSDMRRLTLWIGTACILASGLLWAPVHAAHASTGLTPLEDEAGVRAFE